MAVARPRAGRDYPRNWSEFLALFSSEEDCLAYLERVRWGQGFNCPRCGSINAPFWQMGDGRRRCKLCRGETTVTAGTIFHKTRYDLRIWFAAIWHVVNAKNGVSAMTIYRTFGFGSYQTAWAWLHKLRRAMVRRDRPGLSGTVEVDESFFGGAKSGPPGRGAAGKQTVAIAIEDHGGSSGRLRMERIPKADRVHLHDFIQRNIFRGSTVITDGWPSYKGIDKLGYDHQPRVQRNNPTPPHKLLPHVHRVSALVKRWLLGTHQALGRRSSSTTTSTSSHSASPPLLEEPRDALLTA